MEEPPAKRASLSTAAAASAAAAAFAPPLITLLEKHAELFGAEILPKLDYTDRAMFARVSRQCKVAASPLNVCVVCEGGAVLVDPELTLLGLPA